MRARIALSVFFAVGVSACQQPKPPASTPPPSLPAAQSPTKGGWVDFTSAEDGFAASFPTYPEKTGQDNQYDFGKVAIRAYSSHPRQQGPLWRIASHNYPEPFASQMNPQSLITQMRDGMAANTKARIEEAREVSLNGYPGQEFVAQSTDPITGKPLTTKMRLIAVRSRVYQIMLVAAAGDEALGDDASRFFASFRLVK
jgi:hypothetical protein